MRKLKQERSGGNILALIDGVYKVPEKRARYADGGGLYFMVGASGERKWTFRYKSRSERLKSGDPKPVEMGLGRAPTPGDAVKTLKGIVRECYPGVSLADARKAAAECRALLVQRLDPLTERRRNALTQAPLPMVASPSIAAERPAGERNITFGEFADRYFETMVAGKFKNPKHVEQWKRSLTELAEPIRPLIVREIDTPHVLALLRPIFERTHETGKRVQERIAKVLQAATVEKYRVGPNPADWLGNLKSALPTRPESDVKNHEAIPFAQMPAFMVRLRERDSLSALALQWTIGTVARTSETIGARWTEIDFEERLWTVPADRMKKNREHRVPLTDSMMDLLAKLKAISGAGEFMFALDDKPLSNMAMAELLKGMRGKGPTVHGMRSSFSDWGNETTDFDPMVIDFCLAHINSDKTERAYRRGDALAKRRTVLTAWDSYLAG